MKNARPVIRRNCGLLLEPYAVSGCCLMRFRKRDISFVSVLAG